MGSPNIPFRWRIHSGSLVRGGQVSIASKIALALVVVAVIFAGLAYFFLSSASSSTPSIKDRNTVDHISYSNT